MVRYNAALSASDADRHALLRELLAEAGDGAVIRPPFHCDYGYNIRIGLGVFFNFNCVVLDVVAVTVGARTQIGPAVQIYTADHPRDPSVRRTGAEFGRPIRIGQDGAIARVRHECDGRLVLRLRTAPSQTKCYEHSQR